MQGGIRIEGLRRRYGAGDTAVDELKGVDMTVAPGEVDAGRRSFDHPGWKRLGH
jgi:hypothetical protein